MAKTVKHKNPWPKSIVAIFGVIMVGVVSYLTNNPHCLWALILIMWLVSYFD